MLNDFILQHDLSVEFSNTAEQYFIPLAEQLYQQSCFKNMPFFIGVNGCQGSGKSTFTAFLTAYLTDKYGLNIINLSLDDFYLSKNSRLSLANNIHPLLATRGVPGTHDTALLERSLIALKQNTPNIKLSQFNKATDDLYPEELWPTSPNNVDIVFLEGWCWGVDAEPEDALKQPINNFEQENDTDAAWRNYVNTQLKEHYEHLYSFMDVWVMLKAPHFDSVEQWRWQQEEKLALKSSGAGVMNKQQVHNFIQYYQRLTNVCLTTLPKKCDWVLPLNNDRKISEIIFKDNNIKDKSMTKQSLIFTDLDGTLLDHFDYSFDQAKDVINELKKRNIPIIPNTSKTYAEVVRIQANLGLNTPFIIENGAAVYIPVNYFKTQPEETILIGNYWVKEFCPPRQYWLELLENLEGNYTELFQGFSKLSLEELCNLTGLTIENAKYAIKRQYTEPLLWHGDNNNKRDFIIHMESLGAHMLQGGRFLHVGGHTDKGLAMTWLSNAFSKQLNVPMQNIALGDSHNDNAMLETADFAMQIKSPIHPFPILNKTENSFRSTDFGPKGWAECLTSFFFLQQQVLKIGGC